MGVNYYFPRWVFLKIYSQTAHKALNGKNNLSRKEGCGSKVGMTKIYGLTVIDNEYFQGVPLPLGLETSHTEQKG